jgi:hypothetical protein
MLKIKLEKYKAKVKKSNCYEGWAVCGSLYDKSFVLMCEDKNTANNFFDRIFSPRIMSCNKNLMEEVCIFLKSSTIKINLKKENEV